MGPARPGLWGVLAFREHVRGGLYIVLAVASGLIMAGAVLVLARSPLLSGESARTEEDQRGGDDMRSGPGQHGGQDGGEYRTGRGQREAAAGPGRARRGARDRGHRP
jgi:hypothetical protein